MLLSKNGKKIIIIKNIILCKKKKLNVFRDDECY